MKEECLDLIDKYSKMANNKKSFSIKNYVFLINDSSQELYQHFCQKYMSDISCDNIINILNYKYDFCKNIGVKYIFGVNPDKSFCLHDIIKNDNNYDIKVNRYFVDVFKKKSNKCKCTFIDFYDVFKNLDNSNKYFYKSDSHVNNSGSLLYVEYLNKILNIDNDLKTCLIKTIDNNFVGDLLHAINYDIPNIDPKVFIESTEKISISVKHFEFVKLPLIYSTTQHRQNINVINHSCRNKLKVIFLCGSTTFTSWSLYAYNFYQTIFIWDHLYFPKNLITEIRPDYVIELRTERFMNKYKLLDYEYYTNELNTKKYDFFEINTIHDDLIIKYYNVIYHNNNNNHIHNDINYIKKYLLFIGTNMDDIKNMSILPNDFDTIIYAKLNPDVYDAYNYDNKSLIRHYLLHGVKENRKYKYSK